MVNTKAPESGMDGITVEATSEGNGSHNLVADVKKEW